MRIINFIVIMLFWTTSALASGIGISPSSLTVINDEVKDFVILNPNRFDANFSIQSESFDFDYLNNTIEGYGRKIVSVRLKDRAHPYEIDSNAMIEFESERGVMPAVEIRLRGIVDDIVITKRIEEHPDRRSLIAAGIGGLILVLIALILFIKRR